MPCAANISDSFAKIPYMQLCAVAPRTVELKCNLNFAFKVGLNCDAVKLRKCDYGLIKKNLSIADQFLINQ
jgi:hypothetical protein